MASIPNPPRERAGPPALLGQSGTWLYRLLHLGITLAAVGLTLIYAHLTVDDSFITFRYGKNLIEHGLWNWNPDHARVEGYTSSLYALLSITPALLLPLTRPEGIIFSLCGLFCHLALNRPDHFARRSAAPEVFGLVRRPHPGHFFVYKSDRT